MALNPGEVIHGRYRILHHLGKGGFGTVYKAFDNSLQVDCAIKENTSEADFSTRQFFREATLLASLRHPNLPRVTDYFSLGDQSQYLVMDFIEGDDLQVYLSNHPQGIPIDQVLSWIYQVCDALAYLHSQNPPVVHRDVKPANIKITPQGQAVLVDFGIAKVYNPGDSTTVGARALTPGFSPPEQYGMGGRTGPRSDIYALGATIYNLLTGEFPVESIDRVGGIDLVSPRELNPAIPPHIEHAILRAMELQPAKRWDSALHFKAAIQSPQAAFGETVLETDLRGYQGIPPHVDSTLVYPGSRISEKPTYPVSEPVSAASARKLNKWVFAGAAAAALLFLAICIGVVALAAGGKLPFGSSVAQVTTTAASDLDTRLLSSQGTQMVEEAAVSPSPLPDTPTPTAEPSPTPTPTATPEPVPQIQSTSIGQSVEGRNIPMTRIGFPGTTEVILIGALDGTQEDTESTLIELVAILAEKIDSAAPPGLEFLIIPSINPDGSYHNSRYNANNVDLNRNFSTSNWLSNPPVPGAPNGKEGAGGPYPFSEPETQAVQTLVESLRQSEAIYLITFHSTVARDQGEVLAGIVDYAVDPDSDQLARRIQHALGYNYATEWDYETPGESIDWAAGVGVPSADIIWPKSSGPAALELLNAILSALNDGGGNY